MGQQLGIIVLVDTAAAIEDNDLHGHLWLVDNGGWNGSTGEGTGNLVTALDMTDAAEAGLPLLNWRPLGIGAPPLMAPRIADLAEQDRRDLARQPDYPPRSFSPRRRTILGDEVTLWPPGHSGAIVSSPRPASRFAGQGFLYPGAARFLRTRRSRVAHEDDLAVEYHNDPVIDRIAGEAVEAGSIFPAQYGSPDLFSDGLYWSASIDPRILGLFRYTMWITLSYSRRDAHGKVETYSLTLPHDAWIKITTGALRDGFGYPGFDIVSV